MSFFNKKNKNRDNDTSYKYFYECDDSDDCENNDDCKCNDAVTIISQNLLAV